MKKKTALSVLALILLLGQTLKGQEASPFSPFVSRFQVFVEEGSVKLTWLDSPEKVARYKVFRHTEEITGDNFQKAVNIADVEAGKGFFIDHPREDIDFFYAVLAVNEDGELYKLFIPFRNKSVRSVAIRRTPVDAEAAAAVTGLKALAQENSINLSFKTSRRGRDISVYRNTSPIATVQAVRDSQVVGVISSDKEAFTDYALPGVSYYYALIDTQIAASQGFSLTMGQNATSSAAEIPLSGASGSLSERVPIRSRPLPTLVLSKSIESGKDLPVSLPTESEQPLRAATEKAVRGFIEGLAQAPAPDLEVQILDIDKAEAPVGESYLLFKILTNEFKEKNWEGAEKLILEFLTVRRSKPIEGRAYFYLGQARFFQGSYKDAFMAFLYAQDEYYAVSQPWIDATLTHLRTGK